MSIQKVEGWLDAQDPWAEERDEQTLNEAIKELFRLSLENSADYRNYCESHGIKSSEDIESVQQIPLLPVDIFKRKLVLNVAEEEIEAICTSSGTTGNKSKVGRDPRTLENGRKAFAQNFTKVSGVSYNSSVGFFMPFVSAPEDKFVTWMLEILPPSCRKFADQIFSFFGPEGLKSYDEIKELIRNQEPAPRNLLSTPPPLYNFCSSLNEKIPLEKDSYLITGGGWKTEKEIDRDEFNKVCSEAFDIPKHHIRDTLSMTELTTPINECEYQRKHIPPWVKVTVRDTNDPDKEVEDGTEGLLGFMEPISTSYPAFVLTKDLCTVHDEPCPCGRKGKTLTYRGRAQGAEARGCAMLEEHIE